MTTLIIKDYNKATIPMVAGNLPGLSRFLHALRCRIVHFQPLLFTVDNLLLSIEDALGRPKCYQFVNS